MGIEDIQISEELKTNAPSIKYRGDEGPKSPQEEQQRMMMAQLEQEYSRYVFEMEEQGIQPMTLQQFMEQAMAEGQMSSAQPMAPQGMPPRQMAAFGGIMGLDGRRQYGFGSSLKKRIRKLIPNEVAKVAEVAAPFVAPFNPIAAGLMSGIGGFDRTGKIGSSIKSGLMNYGLGQGARYLGGAGVQTGINPMTGSGVQGGKFFSSPMGSGGVKNLFNKSEFVPSGNTNVRLDQQPSLFSNAAGTGDASIASDIFQNTKGVIPQAADVASKTQTGGILNTIKDFALDNKLLVGIAAGTLGMGALMGNMEPDEIQDLQRGEGLDIKGIRTEVIEAMKDSSGEKLKAIRIKYPFLGTRASKNQEAMAMGGRIGYMGGGMAMGDPRMMMPQSRMPMEEGGIMDLGGMEKDYRAEGGFVPIGAKEKADDVPARLSVNEFVFTADAVRSAGGGDIDKGAEIMENMMKNLEAGGQVSEESQGMAGAQQMFETSQRLNEVI